MDSGSSMAQQPGSEVVEDTTSSAVRHHMVTRARDGIHKPKQFPPKYKMFLVNKSTHLDEPTTIQEALNSQPWLTAMREEIDALKRNKTWTLVPFSSSYNLVGNKWVYKIKYNADGTFQRCKARLVAKGFMQTPGIDFSETFSPVIKASTIKVILTIVVSKDWTVRQLDINNAFLNGQL